MTQNPYSSPKAVAPEDVPSARRPAVVNAAATTLLVAFALGLAKLMLFTPSPWTPGLIIGYFLVGGIAWLHVLAVRSRRNWARWVVICLFALGIAVAPWAFKDLTSDVDRGVYLVQALLQAITVVLMLLPSAGRWYRPNNSSKPTPLRGAA